jgi:4-amino-4-deoxy-L-arabinose transferase-like glycosyltransferase
VSGPTARFSALPRAGKIFLAALIVALGVRLLAVAATDNYPLRTDSSDYQRHAVSISEGDGYPESTIAPGGGPTAFRPPLYPYFMGTVYSVTGRPTWNVVRAAQAFLGVLTVALIALIALRIWGQRVALIAAWIAAVYPPLMITDATILGESLFLPLELGALAAAIEFRRRDRSYWWLLLAGGLVGLAALTRANGIVMLLPLIVAVWPSWRSRLWARAAPAAALVGAALLVIAPWTVRNAVEMDAFIPVTSQTGWSFAGTYNETARDEPAKQAPWYPPDRVPEFADLFEPQSGLDEVALDRELRDRALDYATDHPLYVVEAGAWNGLRLFDLTGFGYSQEVWRLSGVSPGAATLGVLGFYMAGVFALIGAFTRAARSAPLFIWLTPLVFILPGRGGRSLAHLAGRREQLVRSA